MIFGWVGGDAHSQARGCFRGSAIYIPQVLVSQCCQPHQAGLGLEHTLARMQNLMFALRMHCIGSCHFGDVFANDANLGLELPVERLLHECVGH